jgi:putative oxidoreductase
MGNLQEYVFGLTRIVFGVLFACHGAMKLFGAFEGHVMIHNPWMLAAGILEFGGGSLVALGLMTRPVAFILSGEMAVAYFRAHAGAGFWPIQNKGELAVLFCFFFLYLSTRGPGRLSLDGSRGKS